MNDRAELEAIRYAHIIYGFRNGRAGSAAIHSNYMAEQICGVQPMGDCMRPLAELLSKAADRYATSYWIERASNFRPL